MSEYPKDSFNNPNLHSGVTPEQIPHSGVHHDEYPVDEFDNTPLPEAMERGLVNPTPDTPAWLEQIESTEKKSHKKLIIGGAAFLAGAALVAGSVIGLKAAGDAPKNSAPEPDPKATSQTPEATPTPSSTPEQQLTVQSLEIPSTSSPEQIATAFSDRLTKYTMASSNPETYKERLTYQGGTSNQFAIERATKDAAIFNEAIFIKGFESDPGMLKYADAWKSINTSVTEEYLITYDSNDPQDKEPFAMSSTLKPGSEKVLSQNASSITMEFTITDHNNADKNRIGSQYDPGALSINGAESVITATFNAVDGNYKISALDVVTLAK